MNILHNRKLYGLIFIMLVFVVLSGLQSFAYAEADPIFTIPNIDIGISDAQEPEEISSTIQVIVLLTILALAPSILVLMTCFTRIIIILSFLRKALALQTTPPNQVLVGLALFMTFFLMAPTFSEIKENAYDPLLKNEISREDAFDNAINPLRDFMLRQVRSKDLALFVELADVESPETIEDIPTSAIIPAFIISELKTGFEVGFLLFIPFIVIDMVVASTLMSLGMMMLPPVMISLPFKLLLFIMIDGWNLIVRSIIAGIR